MANNTRFIKVLSYKDAACMRFNGLPLYRLAVTLILCFVLWTPCAKANGFELTGFSTSSAGNAEEMRTYTVVDGLVGPVVPVIFQDSRGFLWFGSKSGGVSRFDGRTFEQFRLEDDLANGVTEQVLEDRWGHIWFLSRLPKKHEGTLSYFNGTNIETVGVATCLAVDRNGDIWAANNRGLTHYTGTYTSYSPDEPARSQKTKGSSIELTHYPFQEITDATVNVLFQSKSGTFWIGGSAADGILILSFDPNSSEFKAIDTNITRHNKDGTVDMAKSVPVLSSADGTYAIYDIAQGPYGIEHLWFAGRNLLLQFDGETLHQIRPDPQNQDQTHVETRSPDDTELHYDHFHYRRIWFCDGGKVKWWDGNGLRKLYQIGSGEHLTEQSDPRREASRPSNLLEFFGTLKMQDTLGNLWFVSPTSVYQYNRVSGLNKVYTIEDGLGSENIQTVFEEADGKIWFGHDNGATVFNPRSAFVNFKARPTLGSNSVHQIYENQDELWFGIPGGITLYIHNHLYQQRLHPDYLKNEVKPKTDALPVASESDPKLIGSKNSRAEIVKIFQNRRVSWLTIWLINRSNQTSSETIYTFFFRENLEFKQLSIRVQTEKGRKHHPEVLISSPENPCIAFGGWLFKPYSDGLKWLSPQGTHTFEFQESPRFEDIPKIEHGPSAIIDMHTDKYGKIWCYLEDGTVQSYMHLNRENIPEVVQPEVVPVTEIKPLRLPNPKVTSRESSENTAPKWFFNSEKKQIIYWNIEKLQEPTTVEGVFKAPPLAIWESADAAETAFIFPDGLKKYRGTQLIHEEDISIAEVNAALLTDAQVLWLATKQGAVRYDGTALKTYDIEDGFLVNDLRDVHEDTWGHIWFATWGGGAVRYDGETFTPVTTRDGLAHNSISDIHQSKDGHIWFATEGGVTRYIPADGALPFCNITAVKANETYTDIPATGFAFPSHVNDITFHFEGINPLRLRHHLTYEFKLLGLGENDWTRGSTQTPTHLLQDGVRQTFATSTPSNTDTSTPREDPSVTYQGLKPGKYTFLVKTYRKGWPYTSAPAAVNFTIATPFWAQWRSYLPYLILVGLLITIVPYLLARLLVNRRRVAGLRAEMQQKEEAEMQQLRAELEEARNMQTALLPTEVPEVEGLDVAGMSLPATQVGGDFYDYLNAGEKRLAIAVADAAGKGLRGALNAVLTNGMLNEIVQVQYNADVILTNLNASLVPRLYGRTFIALNLAIIDTENKQILYANAGQPYPILQREGTLVEIEASELPLGGMKRTQYGQERFELAPGDTYIFYTDGVIEALNSEEEMYGTERLKSVLVEAPEHLNAEELIASIFKDIEAFVQTAEQYDDITIVVVKHQPTTQ